MSNAMAEAEATTLPEAPWRLLARMVEPGSTTLPRLDDVTRPRWPRHILVGTDGSLPAEAAIVAARELARRSGALVEMVAVYQPHIPLPPSLHRRGFGRCEAPDRSEAARVLRAVRRHRRALIRERPVWPLRLDVGDPASVIVRLAKEIRADLVVLGIGARDPADRSHDGRTAASAARYLSVPVFVAAAECHVATRCVVALPDGRAHSPTLRAALACMPPGGTMWVALPERPASGVRDGIESGSAREIVARACDRELAARAEDVELRRVDIVGDVLAGVLKLGADVKAELIAVPMRGMPGPVRAFLPNLAEPLLLTARCSVLVVPDQGDDQTDAEERPSGQRNV